MRAVFGMIVAAGVLPLSFVAAGAGPAKRPGGGPMLTGRALSRQAGPMHNSSISGRKGVRPAEAGRRESPGGRRANERNVELKGLEGAEHVRLEGPGRRSFGAPSPPGVLLIRNPVLAERVARLLPAGMDPFEASQGFRNLGQLLAAVHVSRNLDLPFDLLYASMLEGNKLGTSIRELRPDADHLQEMKRAEFQARIDLQEIEDTVSQGGRRTEAPPPPSSGVAPAEGSGTPAGGH